MGTEWSLFEKYHINLLKIQAVLQVVQHVSWTQDVVVCPHLMVMTGCMLIRLHPLHSQTQVESGDCLVLLTQVEPSMIRAPPFLRHSLKR